MQLVLVTSGAELLPLDALGMQTLVLRAEVVPIFALAAREDDLVARHDRLPSCSSGVELPVDRPSSIRARDRD